MTRARISCSVPSAARIRATNTEPSRDSAASKKQFDHEGHQEHELYNQKYRNLRQLRAEFGAPPLFLPRATRGRIKERELLNLGRGLW